MPSSSTPTSTLATRLVWLSPRWQTGEFACALLFNGGRGEVLTSFFNSFQLDRPQAKPPIKSLGAI